MKQFVAAIINLPELGGNGRRGWVECSGGAKRETVSVTWKQSVCHSGPVASLVWAVPK